MRSRIHFIFGFVFVLFTSMPQAGAQIITRIAGQPTSGFGGDGGPATDTSVKFYGPWSIALDPFGNLYIDDMLNNRIRKISSSGIITTVAGTGALGYSGDGGPATAAQLYAPLGVASDAAGNIYTTDGADVRKIDLSGIIDVFAGSFSVPGGFSGDGGPATAALFYGPEDIATDGAGNLYICDIMNRRIRKVDALGIVTTFAGNGMSGYTGDGGPATDAQLIPRYIAADRIGNVFISDADHHNIRKVDAAGIITTYAGNGIAGYSGDGGPATAAELSDPLGIAADTLGNLFICDNVELRVRKVGPTGIITTVAGNGMIGFSGEGGPATACGINPWAIAINWSCGENIYISDYNLNQIFKIVYHNDHPTFTGGHTQTLSVCRDSGAVSINSLLAISDSDTGQPEVWHVLTAPHHGAIAGAYAATSSGGIITPTGLSYTPAPGYTGADTFSVVVIDCGNAPDTTTVYVSFDSLPVAGTVSGPDTVCIGSAVTLTGTVTGGVWGSGNANAAVVAGVMTGMLAGTDTISYTITNACGTAAASFVVTVTACPSGIPGLPGHGGVLEVAPNPNSGMFTLNISSAMDEEAQIVITDAVGEIVRQFPVATNKAIDIQLNVAPGAYFLSATTSRGKWGKRIVVVK